MTLGERIKKLRNEKGITQLELAKALFVTDRAVSKWEQGRGNPDLETIPIISSYFGVSIDYLMTGEEHNQNLDENEHELISYFECVVGQELSNEYIQRSITKHLEKYSVPKIKDALDICYDTYLLKKDKPLQIDDIKDALNKLGGILYNNDLPALDRAINRLMCFLQKNTREPSVSLRRECERELRKLLKLYSDRFSDNERTLRYVDKIYRYCVENKLELRWGARAFKDLQKMLKDKGDSKETHNNENSNLEQFASIGNGKIKLSIGACHLISNYDSYHYVSFTRTKKDRIYFVGLHFEKNKDDISYPLYKEEDGEHGAIIFAGDLLRTLYGEEGVSKNYTKHEVVLDSEHPDTLVIYYNYKKKHYVRTDKEKALLRTKHINTIVDKEWKVISSSSKAKNGKKYPTYLLKNINNDEEIEISTRALIDIERGLSSIDNIKMSREIGAGSYLGIKRAAKKKRIKSLDNNLVEKDKESPQSEQDSDENKRITDVKSLSNEQIQRIKKSDLFNELKAWRQKTASEYGSAAFTIASDRMLLSVALIKPKNKEELLKCYGFGKKKVADFGYEILSIVNKY